MEQLGRNAFLYYAGYYRRYFRLLAIVHQTGYQDIDKIVTDDRMAYYDHHKSTLYNHLSTSSTAAIVWMENHQKHIIFYLENIDKTVIMVTNSIDQLLPTVYVED